LGGLKLTAAEFFRIAKALSDPRRCEILETIAPEGESCCGHLVAKLPVAQATVSHHLKELATAGLLKVRREGQFSYYKFCPDVLKAYLVELEARYRCCGHAHDDSE
jgi:ArsR family transcriptional regulator